MSGHWFRFYDDAINDPKVLRMPAEMRWQWVAMLCIASQSKGKISSHEDVSLLLRVTVSQAAEIIRDFVSRGLLDKTRDGAHEPHNWRKRQYKSDLSTPRVKQFRKRFKSVAETPPDTEQIQNRTEKKETPSLRSGGKKSVDLKSCFEGVLDASRAAAVVEHRAKLRKPMTAHGARLLADKFAACPDPNAAADAMIANGWQGFDADWLRPGGRAPPAGRVVNGFAAHALKLMRQDDDQRNRSSGAGMADHQPPRDRTASEPDLLDPGRSEQGDAPGARSHGR